jgi:hypothetical protein
MATKVYEEHPIYLIDGTKVLISPLKIKYLHPFMETFLAVKNTSDDFEAIALMVECVRISMEQYYPALSLSTDAIEDSLDLPTIYKILDYAAGIKINGEKEESVKSQAEDGGSSWSDLDLTKLESEIFLIGAWENYDALERSLSMPELLGTISIKRELDHLEKKFLAAMQGVDIDEGKNEDAWEEMKRRVLYKGKNPDDITTLTGARAMEAGFGVGMGLDYEEITA